MSVITDPDCAAGKHRNCDGTGWDADTEQLVPCPCSCHEMRVLTVRQPWAWAIVHGGKDVENRVRNVAGEYRGPLAIHVAKRADDEYADNMAAAFLPQAPSTGWPWPTYSAPFWGSWGDIIGVVDLTSVHNSEECFDLCSVWGDVDAHHLMLSKPRPLATPIPFTGALGLRRLDPTTIAKIQEQL